MGIVSTTTMGEEDGRMEIVATVADLLRVEHSHSAGTYIHDDGL